MECLIRLIGAQNESHELETFIASRVEQEKDTVHLKGEPHLLESGKQVDFSCVILRIQGMVLFQYQLQEDQELAQGLADMSNISVKKNLVIPSQSLVMPPSKTEKSVKLGQELVLPQVLEEIDEISNSSRKSDQSNQSFILPVEKKEGHPQN